MKAQRMLCLIKEERGKRKMCEWIDDLEGAELEVRET